MLHLRKYFVRESSAMSGKCRGTFFLELLSDNPIFLSNKRMHVLPVNTKL